MIRIAILTSFLALSACVPRPRYVWYSELPAVGEQGPRVEIHPGDTILVQVTGHKDLSGEFVVGAAGEYSHPIVGLIEVGGLDAGKAADIVASRLAKVIQEPRVALTLLSYSPLNVTVIGEVGTAGSFEVAHGSGVLAAIGRAGGLSEFADVEEIYVVRSQPSAQRIRFRYSDLTRPDPAALQFRLRDGDTVLVE